MSVQLPRDFPPKETKGKKILLWENPGATLVQKGLPLDHLLRKVYGEKVWTASEEDEDLMNFINDPAAGGAIRPAIPTPTQVLHPYLQSNCQARYPEIDRRSLGTPRELIADRHPLVHSPA